MGEPPASDKPRYVNHMFGRIAGRYDLGNRVLSLGRDQSWRRAAVAALHPNPTDTVLDIGAGTADLALEMARRTQRVVALDFTRPMLLYGAHKAQRSRYAGRIDFVHSDALRLPFPDGTFDGAATAFTVRNLESMERGFAEIFRVLKPRGRLVCLEFTQPPSRVVNGLYRPYLRHILPLVGRCVTGDAQAYRYLSDSIKAFPLAEDLARVIRGAGFADVTWRFLSLGVVALHVADRPAAVPAQGVAA